MPPRPAALAFAEQLLDPGSFRSWDTPPQYADAGPEYLADLARARQRSGADEAALTGEGRLGGHRVALLLSEFAFLGGSIGTATAARLLHAIERATAEGLPLLGFPASGGTRMQEGTPAFVRMIAITNAVTAHKAAGLPYLVHLRHPTTGGVLASWGSLGQLTTAEPGALIGFLGPRVYAALYGAPFPAGVQRAEHLERFGTVDAVLGPEQLRERLVATLDVLLVADRVGEAVNNADYADGRVVDAAINTAHYSSRAATEGVDASINNGHYSARAAASEAGENGDASEIGEPAEASANNGHYYDPRPPAQSGSPSKSPASRGAPAWPSCWPGPTRWCRSRAPERASVMTRCAWHWPGSRGSPAWWSGTIGQRPSGTGRSDRPGCAPRGAACGWRPSCGCRC